MTFVQGLCGGFNKPDVALVLFAKESPWTRGYVRRDLEAWYTGSRSAKASLKFDEEVIVLHHPNPGAGAIIVNGGGASFDVIRLDGACATLSGNEVTLKRPPAPKHPPVPWRQLDPRVRDVLMSDSRVSQASAAYDGACADAASGACAKASAKLTSAIVDFLGRGAKLPALVTWR